MPPKKPTPAEDPNQGAFFGVEVAGNGATDPANFRAKARIVEPGEEGVYYPPSPEAVQPVTVTPVETVKAGLEKTARTRRNRSKGNEGKHSARDPETGSYAAGLKLGAFLPGFGPVMERNWDEAKAFAQRLDAERQKRHALAPTFDADTSRDIRPVVEEIAAQHDIERALTDDGEEALGNSTAQPASHEHSTAPLITSEQKLHIIREQAGFAPATHDEKNTAIGLIFSATENGAYWVHSYLMETYDHLVKHYANTEGRVLNEAKKMASDGVVSRINEMGDYLQGAVDDGKALQWLNDKVDTVANPALTLEEAVVDSFEPVGEDEEARAKDEQTMLWAVAAIVRYYDHETHQEVPFTPMTEREDRSVDSDEEGKNKQLYNPYVAAFLLSDERSGIMDKYAAIRTHISELMSQITVKELRTLVPKALADQRNRYRFWRQALADMKGPYKEAAKRRLDS
jgi:hypothetical protein